MPALYNTTESGDAVSAVGGSAPALNDTVIFSEEGPSLTTNLTGYTNNLDLYHETSNFSGSVGTATQGLLLDADAILIESMGAFGHYYGTGNTWPVATINPALRTRQTIIKDVSVLTSLNVHGGNNTIYEDVATLTTARVAGGFNTFRGQSGTTAVGTLVVTSSPSSSQTILELHRDAGAISVGNAVLRLMKNWITPTGMTLWPGGRIEGRSFGAFGGALTTHAGSVLDWSQAGRDISINNWVVEGETTVVIPKGDISGWHHSEVGGTFTNNSGIPVRYREAS
jgi:hypothetical protein